MSSKITPAKPFILMMYGFPGAGKTAFARQFSDELGIVHLQEDRMIHDFFGGNMTPTTTKAARKIMDFMAHDYLKAGISLVYDANVMRASERRRVREIAHQFKAVPILLWLQVDPETTFSRVEKRDRRKSDDKYANEYTESEYRQILSHMQNPAMHEDYIVVSGKHTFSSQRSSVMKRLYDLGIFSSSEATPKMIKPELTNLIPKAKIQMRGDIIQRNISIR